MSYPSYILLRMNLTSQLYCRITLDFREMKTTLVQNIVQICSLVTGMICSPKINS